MTWLYIMSLIFLILTIYLVYKDYKENKFSKKTFIFVSAMICFAIIGTVILKIISIILVLVTIFAIICAFTIRGSGFLDVSNIARIL